MIKPLILPDYYKRQLELEEDYHAQLQEIVGGLTANLIAYFDDQTVTLFGVMDIYDKFVEKNSKGIHRLNSQYAVKIYKLAENTMPTGNFGEWGMVRRLADDLNIKSTNLLQTILSRFIMLIPVGYVGLGSQLYTDESTRPDLIRRNDSSISRYVQTAITSAVGVVLLFNFNHMGYTEYQADNMHDNVVRDSHREYNDGKTWHRLDNPPPCGHPGVPTNCRCWYKAVR